MKSSWFFVLWIILSVSILESVARLQPKEFFPKPMIHFADGGHYIWCQAVTEGFLLLLFQLTAMLLSTWAMLDSFLAPWILFGFTRKGSLGFAIWPGGEGTS